MPAAKNKDELLKILETEYIKLQKTLSSVDTALAIIPSKDDEATIKDTIAHRTHWMGLFNKWYSDAKNGLAVQTPAEGYKWNQLKEYNGMVREASRPRSWEVIHADFKKAHADLTALLTSLDNKTLYTPHLYPWMNNWTLGRWAEASGPSHYRSANKYVRKIIREQKA
jgi:hypothetical protein